MSRPNSKVTVVRRTDGRLIVKSSWCDEKGRHFIDDAWLEDSNIIADLMEEVGTVGLAEVEVFLHTSRRFYHLPHYETIIFGEMADDEAGKLGYIAMRTKCVWHDQVVFANNVAFHDLDEDQCADKLCELFNEAIQMYGTGNHHIIVN